MRAWRVRWVCGRYNVRGRVAGGWVTGSGGCVREEAVVAEASEGVDVLFVSVVAVE